MNEATLSPAGIQAAQIEDLWWVMFVVCLGVFLGVLGFLAVAAFRRRPIPAAVGSLPQDPDVERRLFRAVSIAVGITVILLFVLLISSFATSRNVGVLTSEQPLTLEVTAHQWWWEVHYIDGPPNHRLVTANEIHIPVGRPILVKLSASDVIHSFWVPALQGKRDLIPGQQNRYWLRADRPGIFEGQCAEYCGHQHAHMRFRVVAESPETFQQWYEAQLQPAADPSDAQLQHGQQVFLGSSCILCHTIQGTIAGATNGPNLTHVGSRATLGAGTIPNEPQALHDWIADPQKVKPGARMPANGLPQEDLNDVVAYLRNLK